MDTNTNDDVHDWRLMTEAEIMSDSTLVDMLDYDNQGLVDVPIDAMDVQDYIKRTAAIRLSFTIPYPFVTIFKDGKQKTDRGCSSCSS